MQDLPGLRVIFSPYIYIYIYIYASGYEAGMTHIGACMPAGFAGLYRMCSEALRAKKTFFNPHPENLRT
jgi:hypothetical protein